MKTLTQGDKPIARLLRYGAFEKRPRGGYRFGTKRIDPDVVERLIAAGLAQRDGERIVELSLKTGDKVHQFIGNGLLAWAHGALGHDDVVRGHREAGQALAQAMGGRVMLGDWFDAMATAQLQDPGRSSTRL